jgi:hypothetical protein
MTRAGRQASSPRAADPAMGRAYGLEKRVSWTASRIQGTPEPPAPYRTEAAFPKLKFSEPLALAHTPGGDRLFLAERCGRILSFLNDPAVEKANLVVDLKRQVLGLVLHPDFGKNGSLLVTMLIDPAAGRPRRARVSRFKVVGNDPPRADPASEQMIIEWPSQYHDGGCLMFGPDGCLYGPGSTPACSPSRYPRPPTSCRAWWTPPTRARTLTAAPARISTPTARTATEPSAEATRASSFSPHSSWARRAFWGLAPRWATSTSPTPALSHRGTPIAP